MKFQTTETSLQGAICGRLWMPAVTGGRTHHENLRRRFDRFSDGRGATFRDALLSCLTENGGDFQNAQFTADTEIVIVRKARTPTRVTRGEAWTVREYRRKVLDLPDCADLVNADCDSADLYGDDE